LWRLPPETCHENLAIREKKILQILANLGSFSHEKFLSVGQNLLFFSSMPKFGNNSPVKEILPGKTPESQSLRGFCDVAKVERSSRK
jgi:hypothetical protein